ncbi:GcvT family protein [Paramicrobacterium chengjingii]|uniref:FAD-dependent oxidoreductase n=1 Tax=Paramicrobacterium chengjingii TaxID=2769067 RepID=A0ABX6YJ30_9MICO|nr:FAD-dependent oxidoreductase [Microbacterium chengjingii]QPZ38766.1 FAD-dependent oxidoreductase [Microbacterium chengjingii]
MAQLPGRADVVVIGAGVVGNFVVHHLADLGWRNITQIDKGPLPDPGGSTGHASNFVFPVDHSKEITDLTVDSMRQYSDLGVLTRCGGIEVARSEERAQELRGRMTSARSWGIEAELLTPDQIGDLVPYCSTDLLISGFHTPTGAIVDPVRAGALVREEAEQRGALTVCAETEVLDLEVSGGRVNGVVTNRGRIETEIVVVACGVWSPKVAALAGARIPLSPAVHQMIDVGPIPELERSGEWVSFPLVRDMDCLMYERQRGSSLEIGSYAHRPMLHSPGEIPPVGAPGQDSPTSFPFTSDDFAPQLRHAQELFPGLLGGSTPKPHKALNGLLSLTPDGGPLLGETPEVAGLWSAAAVWIKEAPSVGRMIAQWLTDGTTEIDLHAADISRFYPYARTDAHVKARTAEGFPKIYGITHPREQWQSNRPIRTSPFHARTTSLGAVYFEAGGWERPQWYESNSGLVEEYAGRIPQRRAEWDARWWSPIIEAEHLAMRDRVAMVDVSAFAVFDVTGPGALDYLQRLAMAQLDRPVGRTIYTPLLDPGGGFRADLTIVRRGEEDFRVITGGSDGGRDLAWFRAHLPSDGSVHLADMTSAVCSVGVWGPRARDLIAAVTEEDVSDAAFPFGTAREMDLGGLPVQMLRISYVGDLGWEIHAPAEHGLPLWDLLWAAGETLGVVAAGIGVYGTTGRLEKAHRLMGAELTGEYDPVEAGLALPRVKSADFIGKTAYLAAREEEPAATLCTLAVADGVDRFMTGHEPVLTRSAEPIIDAKGRRSFVTSAGPAPSLGRYLLLVYLPPEQAVEGRELLVEYLGERYPVTVLTVGRTAPFDPEMTRVKA